MLWEIENRIQSRLRVLMDIKDKKYSQSQDDKAEIQLDSSSEKSLESELLKMEARIMESINRWEKMGHTIILEIIYKNQKL